MKSSIHAILVTCTVAATVAGIAGTPVLAFTKQVECPPIVKEKAQIPSELDLVVYDKNDKAHCFRWQSDDELQVDIREVARIHKDPRARSVTLVIQRTMADPRSDWETVRLDAKRDHHRYTEAPAYRVHSISIRR